MPFHLLTSNPCGTRMKIFNVNAATAQILSDIVHTDFAYPYVGHANADFKHLSGQIAGVSYLWV
jgi:hypothetical protein